MSAVACPVSFWHITEKRVCSCIRSFCFTKVFLLTVPHRSDIAELNRWRTSVPRGVAAESAHFDRRELGFKKPAGYLRRPVKANASNQVVTAENFFVAGERTICDDGYSALRAHDLRVVQSQFLVVQQFARGAKFVLQRSVSPSYLINHILGQRVPTGFVAIDHQHILHYKPPSLCRSAIKVASATNSAMD